MWDSGFIKHGKLGNFRSSHGDERIYHSGGSHGPSGPVEIDDEDDDLPVKTGDLPIKNGDLPIKNDD